MNNLTPTMIGIILLAAIGGIIVLEKVGGGAFSLYREAKQRDKRIEFFAALTAFFVGAAGLAYSINKTDALEERVLVLEKALEGLKQKL